MVAVERAMDGFFSIGGSLLATACLHDCIRARSAVRAAETELFPSVYTAWVPRRVRRCQVGRPVFWSR
jgi:hypothetical protein